MAADALLVVVGAGASYDCLPDPPADDRSVAASGLAARPWSHVRPPLTADLVGTTPHHNRLVNRYTVSRPVIDELRRRQARAESPILLEQALTDYEAHGSTNPDVQRHLRAFRLYLRDLLWDSTEYVLSDDISGGVTNYVTLLRVLQRWALKSGHHVCVANFNYDLLLEEACASIWQFNPSHFASYVADKRIAVVKPHGSVNWGWPVGDSRLHRPHVNPGAIRRVIDEPCQEAQSTMIPVPRESESGFPVLPALALPVTTKRSLVWPRVHEEHFVGLRGRVGRLLLVGWRGLEPHFFERLRVVLASDVKAMIVMGGPTAADDIDGLERLLRRNLPMVGRVDWCAAGFREFVAGDELDRLLA